MKSKITVDVDHDNQPVLKIEYGASEDVRDKLVKKFLETFGGESRWAEFFHVDGNKEIFSSTALVRPLSPFNTIEHSKMMTYYANKLNAQNGLVTEEQLPYIKVCILPEQSKHSISDCLKELKWNRPSEGQKFLDKCIKEADKLFSKKS